MGQGLETNLTNVAIAYLLRLKVRVTKTSIKQTLEQNPYYPTLFSLSDTFEKFGIKNEGLHVPPEKLNELRPPFAAYLSGQDTGKDFVLVTALEKTSVEYTLDGKIFNKVSKDIFLKDWLGIVFIAEANKESGENDFVEKLKKEKGKARKQSLLFTSASLFFLSLIYIFLLNVDATLFTAAVILSITKILGVFVTVLLLIYDIDKNNSIVKNICAARKQTNCNAVLQSKANRIFGVSWSDAGFFYFASSFLFLIWPSLPFMTKIPYLAILAILTATYIPFSIYYQYKVVRQWCPLCLIVQGILLLEFVWALQFYDSIINLEVNQNSLIVLLISILLPITVWHLLKPILIKAKHEPIVVNAYKRLLYNPVTFKSLMQDQPNAPDGWQQLGITIGNPDATNTILKVCNPYCGPCAKIHSIIEEIISFNKNINLKIIFTATNNADDVSGLVAKHFLSIAQNNNNIFTREALDDWYTKEKKDYGEFSTKYKLNESIENYEIKIEAMSKWCKEAEIIHTPTIFINGKRLIENYDIKQLQFILN